MYLTTKGEKLDQYTIDTVWEFRRGDGQIIALRTISDWKLELAEPFITRDRYGNPAFVK